jgi:Fe-S-cluster containining protein
MGKYTRDGVLLENADDGACPFLTSEGCRVYPDRPLVCRLYPLGRFISGTGQEIFFLFHSRFVRLCGHGQAGTIHDYLGRQDARAFIKAAERYSEIFEALDRIFERNPSSKPETGKLTHKTGLPAPGDDSPPPHAWRDMDATIQTHWDADITDLIDDPTGKMELHIAALKHCLDKYIQGKSLKGGSPNLITS